MLDLKKYIKVISVLILIILLILSIFNLFISNMFNLFWLSINLCALLFLLLIISSIFITYKVVNDKKVSPFIMKINFKIVNIVYGISIVLSKFLDIPKDDIRKIYVKLNNTYIYSQKYNIKSEDILVLIPHCIQKHTCKLKVTNEVKNCKACGLCNVGDLVRLNEKTGVNVFIATGGTLARKKIIETKPKAVVAVACERDLTSGIQDIKHIPVVGVFNKRPNGPCFDTNIDIKEVEDAINFLRGELI